MYDYKRMQRSFLYKIKHISEQAGKLDSITETDVSPKKPVYIHMTRFLYKSSLIYCK